MRQQVQSLLVSGLLQDSYVIYIKLFNFACRVLVKKLANAKSGDWRKWKYWFVKMQSEIRGKQNWELMGNAVVFQWDIKFSLELPCSFDQRWPKYPCLKSKFDHTRALYMHIHAHRENGNWPQRPFQFTFPEIFMSNIRLDF